MLFIVLVMFSVMILSITVLKFTKYNFLCYLLFSDFLVMILSITGEILQFMLFFNYYVSFP